MNDKAMVVAHLFFFIVTVGSLVGFLVYTFRMLREIHPTKQTVANILPFIALAMPRILNNQGQRYRAKAVLWLIAAILSGGLGFATKTY